MNKILISLSLFVMACSNNVSQSEATDKGDQENHNATASVVHNSLQLNKGAKWKADEATRKNVAAFVTVINDSSNMGRTNLAQLTKQLQIRIDTLVQQCKMKGPDHDALHVWLEQVLHDLQEVKAGDHDYQKSYAALKRDVENFYVFFE